MTEAIVETTETTETTLPSDWVKALPEKLQGAPFLRPNKDGSIRTVDEAFSALENAAKLQGNLSESHIKIPGVDAADTDKLAARTRILSLWPDLREVTEGEDTLPPADVAGYKLPEGADVLDATAVEDIGKFALEHKWGQQQFTDYATKMVAAHGASVDTANGWEKTQSDKLNDKLGAARPERLGRVATAMEQFGATPEYVAAIKEGKIDADLVLVLDGLVGKMIDLGDEDTQFVQQVKAGGLSHTPLEHKGIAQELFVKLQSMTGHEANYEELNRKRIEHIGLSMAAQ